MNVCEDESGEIVSKCEANGCGGDEGRRARQCRREGGLQEETKAAVVIVMHRHYRGHVDPRASAHGTSNSGGTLEVDSSSPPPPPPFPGRLWYCCSPPHPPRRSAALPPPLGGGPVANDDRCSRCALTACVPADTQAHMQKCIQA
eukprot:GHVU01148764.1.p1 GENE.GHVU01148764.1~~GHVU01148764.1.p1  ORF type:complete len:145 (+),score=16.51 GHVU01148764.1:1645-2079(+)